MTFSHKFHASSLREYDIRGIVGETLTEADAFAIGRVFGSMVAEAGGRKVAVGRDGRLSSPALAAALIKGLMASGAEVIDVGQGPTPMLYYASFAEPADGAVMVTGSHNPPNYNGFKMMLKNKPFFGKDIQTLGARAEAGQVVPETQGSVVEKDVSEAYVARMLKDWDGERKLKVVWDNGNGAAGDVLVKLVEQLPGEHKLLNAKIDGTFPAHHPDPTVPKNLEQLIDAVKKEGADVGIAFDGDADRIGLVDNEGHILFGDQFLILMARDVLREHPGATIIADVKASQVLFDEVAKAGGTPLMWKTGHSLIKSKMAELGSPLAGEMSGHIFYNDKWYGFDDALYAAVRILGVIARMPETVGEFRASLPEVVNTPELRFDCTEDRKFAVVAEVAERLKAAGEKVADTDGVRVNTEDGWWLLRASNTQAVLVARAESTSEAGLSRLKAALAGQLAASGLAPDFSATNAGH
ncbi:MAG: phosphoglucomutase/phosphomannomutase PgmG [Acidocella sp.]|uniref:phosphoglucomutase/phosphomannomutase PgmG n=1 Tax=Acidocella sp. TaxID=50710 RepID=UPI003FD7274E